MQAFPPFMGTRERRTGIPGKPPDLHDPPPGCPFYARCPVRLDGFCETLTPPLQTVLPDHEVACHLYDEALLAAHGKSSAGVQPGALSV